MPMIFGKKKSLEERLDEILDEISGLSAEKQEELWKKYNDAKDESKGESETEEQIEKAEEDIAEKGADSQDAKDRIDESVGEKKYVERKDYEALLERIAALEKKANDDDELPKPKEIDEEDLEPDNKDFFNEK